MALSDAKLRVLEPAERPYKVADGHPKTAASGRRDVEGVHAGVLQHDQVVLDYWRRVMIFTEPDALRPSGASTPCHLNSETGILAGRRHRRQPPVTPRCGKRVLALRAIAGLAELAPVAESAGPIAVFATADGTTSLPPDAGIIEVQKLPRRQGPLPGNSRHGTHAFPGLQQGRVPKVAWRATSEAARRPLARRGVVVA